jgi:adenine-specific DNA-methyltransferase
MARIEDLIDEIADPALRGAIARQIKLLKLSKRFGLVFEDHVPETVSLHGLPIRPGSIVQNRRKPEETARLQVLSAEGQKATVAPVGLDERVEVVDIADLLAVKAFEEPIFPGLTPVGEVRRGAEGKAAHTVISGENFHALQLVVYTHAAQIDIIYIDPPYNTGARDWKYNNRFVDNNDAWRHSKWLAMMEKRLRLSRKLLKPDGVLIVTIDEHEAHHLGMLLESLFPDAYRQMATIVNNPKGVTQPRFSRVEEYAIFVFMGSASVAGMRDDLLTWGAEFALDQGAAPRWKGLLRSGKESRATDRPNMVYPIHVDEATGQILGAGTTLEEALAENPGMDPDALTESASGAGEGLAWPIRKDGSLGRWTIGRESFLRLNSRGLVKIGRFDPKRNTWAVSYLSAELEAQVDTGLLEVVAVDPRTGVADVRYSSIKARRPKTVWHRSAHDAGVGGSDLLAALGVSGDFDYPKSVYSTLDALLGVVSTRRDALVLDFFAGSGTTLHAVLMLNAQDGGNRQCILVTNNDVSDAEAKRLYKAGHFAGDPEFESQGIFESVSKPRVEAALTGLRPDGRPVKGKYLDQYLPDHSYADGFEENVAFFRMDYLEPDLVELGRQYNAIAPLLWMAAGSVGSWEEWDDKKPWSAPPTSTYAVLFDVSEAVGFGSMLESRREITRVWIVTDSHTAFVEACADLPSGVRAGQLYREYLRNFTVNAPGVLD